MDDPDWYIDEDLSVEDVVWEPVEKWGDTVFGRGTTKEDGALAVVVRYPGEDRVMIAPNELWATDCFTLWLADDMLSDPGQRAWTCGTAHVRVSAYTGAFYVLIERGECDYVLEQVDSYASAVIKAAGHGLGRLREDWPDDAVHLLDAQRHIGVALRQLWADGLIAASSTITAVGEVQIAEALEIGRPLLSQVLAGQAWV
ncbi:hypothetical protein ABZ467_18230 [Streptomyces sp. NPDC005727]|uniref:hypothetical protein n=1 Tax=Streptomyces sp. NPDC005727 TaxID=3157053 RepID=UPI0033CF9CBD